MVSEVQDDQGSATLGRPKGAPQPGTASPPADHRSRGRRDGARRVLATFARSRTLPPPTRLGDAVGLVARLGGWLGRKRDPPGAQLLWHGYIQLVAMAFAFELRDEFG